MESRLKWHLLPDFPDLPNLMISPHFGPSSYTLHVTDLANVWIEKLDRKGILLRSLQENTSIDLSDNDPNQWAVFLSKLKDAFDPTSDDHEHTSLSISASSADKTGEGSLVLHVTCVLPEPLKPLKWPIYLTKSPPVGLTSELVLPLIQGNYARTLEVDDLIATIKEKDAVITKLVDKLEANQIGLEYVFNALSGKRKPSREVAEAKVKGLAVFDEDDWRLRDTTSRRLPRDVPSLIHQLFEEKELYLSPDADIAPSSQLNDWWARLSSHPIPAIEPRRESSKKRQRTPPPTSKTPGEKDDDDFQVQVTPTHLRARRQLQEASQASNDATDEESSPVIIPDSFPTLSQEKSRSRIGVVGGKKNLQDTLASQSSHTVPADDEATASESEGESTKPTSQKRTDTRIGTIGKARESSPLSAILPPEKHSSPAPIPPQDGDETASGSDSEDNGTRPSKLQPSSPPPASSQQNKVGLGRIGGKAKAQALPETPEKLGTTSSADQSPRDTPSPARPTGRKLGTIGKKPDIDGKRPRPDSPSASAELETEEQRMERRRAEIAKELERKAAAPTKKKRKF
ncbi:hypothetical protein M426DRAFT_144324 [Hypoxylon sp. CI-4A]|nr:hypothetical protein M426DRAFT_144324 [Hypoxylon sp. CI-4A]